MSPKIRQERKRGIPGEMRQALDPFFLFTYTLLGIAAVIQILVIVWMDVF